MTAPWIFFLRLTLSQTEQRRAKRSMGNLQLRWIKTCPVVQTHQRQKNRTCFPFLETLHSVPLKFPCVVRTFIRYSAKTNSSFLLARFVSTTFRAIICRLQSCFVANLTITLQVLGASSSVAPSVSATEVSCKLILFLYQSYRSLARN